MPFDVLLKCMHFFFAEHDREMQRLRDVGEEQPSEAAKEALREAAAFAKDAAPYCSPRLTALSIRDWNDMRRDINEKNDQASEAIDVTD